MYKRQTLARTLCGLQKELRGEVLYKNSMVPSKRRIRKAYLVMQDPDYQLFTDSVYQELLLALSDQKDKDEKRIDDILDELNLTIYKERHPMSLSGGQKQRTAIGVAALRDAEAVSYTHLDVYKRQYVFFVYLFDKVGQAVRLAPGADISETVSYTHLFRQILLTF